MWQLTKIVPMYFEVIVPLVSLKNMYIIQLTLISAIYGYS